MDENQKKRRHLPFTKDRRSSQNRNPNLEKKTKSLTKTNERTDETKKKTLTNYQLRRVEDQATIYEGWKTKPK